MTSETRVEIEKKKKNNNNKTLRIMLWFLEVRKSIIKNQINGSESTIINTFKILHQKFKIW